MSFFLIAIPALAGAAYLLGVFDRPKFERHESLVKGNAGAELYCIVATTTEKNIGAHVMRLMEASLIGIQELPHGKAILQNAANVYGLDEGSEKLGVGLFFDDPKQKDAPRWAVGWAVHASSFSEIQRVVEAVQEKSGLTTETIRAVRLGKGGILKATIPWRTRFTPVVGAMLHWSRAFKAYEEGGYTSTCGRDGEQGCVALEVYVTGLADRMKSIDYVVLFGNTKNVWDDCFPEGAK